MVLLPIEKRATRVVTASTVLRAHPKQGRTRFDRQEPIQTKRTSREVQRESSENIVFEEELRRYVAISEKSTYYGLLGIPEDCNRSAIKQSFYSLARKFHPDRHMNSPQCAGALQQLMGAITEAYSVLSHDEKRASYDRKLAHSRMHTGEEDNTEYCFRLATNCQ